MCGEGGFLFVYWGSNSTFAGVHRPSKIFKACFACGEAVVMKREVKATWVAFTNK